MFYIDNVACMVPLSSTAILWTSQCTSNRFIYCLVATRYRRSLYILSSTVQTLFNSPGLSEYFVVVGTEASQEEEERESLRAVGVGAWWKTQHVCFLWPWGRKHWCFPMPPIPIVLRSSFLFLLAHIVIWGKARDFNKHIWMMRAQRWDRKRKKWGPKNSGHGNMEESLNLSSPTRGGDTSVFSQCLPCLLFLVIPSPSFWLTQLLWKIKTEDMQHSFR